jgi:imidazolonepropionase-like amidohydrolase
MATAGTFIVVGDVITAVGEAMPCPVEALTIDAQGGLLMPGLIDAHAHFNYGGDPTTHHHMVSTAYVPARCS